MYKFEKNGPFYLNRGAKILIGQIWHKTNSNFCTNGFFGLTLHPETVDVAQLVRVPDCGSEGRGFESHLPPKIEKALPHAKQTRKGFLVFILSSYARLSRITGRDSAILFLLSTTFKT